MKATYIKGSTLEWKNIWADLGMERDNGGRWTTGENSPDFLKEYCAQFRTPSRAWPQSHAKPLLTQKFAKLLCEKDPSLAIALGVATESEQE